GDRRLAGADEVGAMAELGQDRVEHDTAVRIVLDAQDVERAGRHRARRAGPRLRLGTRGRNQLDRGGEAKRATGAGLAPDRKVAIHRLGDALDEGEPEAGAAITASDLGLGP